MEQKFELDDDDFILVRHDFTSTSLVELAKFCTLYNIKQLIDYARNELEKGLIPSDAGYFGENHAEKELYHIQQMQNAPKLQLAVESKKLTQEDAINGFIFCLQKANELDKDILNLDLPQLYNVWHKYLASLTEQDRELIAPLKINTLSDFSGIYQDIRGKLLSQLNPPLKTTQVNPNLVNSDRLKVTKNKPNNKTDFFKQSANCLETKKRLNELETNLSTYITSSMDGKRGKTVPHEAIQKAQEIVDRVQVWKKWFEGPGINMEKITQKQYEIAKELYETAKSFLPFLNKYKWDSTSRVVVIVEALVKLIDNPQVKDLFESKNLEGIFNKMGALLNERNTGVQPKASFHL